MDMHRNSFKLIPKNPPSINDGNDFIQIKKAANFH